MNILIIALSVEKVIKDKKYHQYIGGKVIISKNPIPGYLSFLTKCQGTTFMAACGCKTAEQALSLCPEKPDAILINDNYQSGFYNDLHKIHAQVEERTEYILSQKINYVMVNYKSAFQKMYPEIKDRILWIPHSVNPDMFKNLHIERDIDTMLLGRIQGLYPFRMFLAENIPGIFTNRVPGSDRCFKRNLEYFYENYVKWLNRAKIAYTDGSRHQYPVKKYFEIPACGALLLCQEIPDLEELGFDDGENCIFIGKNNALSHTRNYLDDNDDINVVSYNGEMFIKAHHTWHNRANTCTLSWSF
jgi:hypothetical protein